MKGLHIRAENHVVAGSEGAQDCIVVFLVEPDCPVGRNELFFRVVAD